MDVREEVGNQLLILLISFSSSAAGWQRRWESVTNPLDKLFHRLCFRNSRLGISY